MYKILELNPEIAKYSDDIEFRMKSYAETKQRLLHNKKSLFDFADAHEYYGFHHIDGGWIYREWAPSADRLYLEGDFNDWNETDHPLERKENGDWEIFLQGDDALWDGCRVKTVVEAGGNRTEHVPLYIKRAVQDEDTRIFCGEVVDDRKSPFEWTDRTRAFNDELYIYETHIGMALEDGRIGSYREFADHILPHIKRTGYTAIQIMAIMEHPYYGSFGYQVSNFYAASSRFGRPEDLKYLVNKAHEMGIRVFLDLVHSHAVKNTADGINMFDGTTWQFFHDGEKGEHPAWGTKCFNYGKDEVLRFLLSNLRFWLEEYHFDGFRFDGITSMLYHDHGLGVGFDADKYFTLNTHIEAVTYLQLANELIREVDPKAITIAEDMSGMPGMCLPVSDGGIGFDYRLGMGIPDMWIKAVKETRDENWDIRGMWNGMCLRRRGEKTVGYAESHDQALVGDQTLMFRMAGAAMYTDMSKDCHSMVIDRAMALHKMIRLFTLVAGGEAYLTFMGNEFGHPEWIDFPREGNGWSHHYCRRQWSLMWNDDLKYRYLYDFEYDMIRVCKENHVLAQGYGDLLLDKRPEKMLAVERGGLLFAFNFHPTQSLSNVLVPVSEAGEYTVEFSTDDWKYGGYGQVYHMTYPTKKFEGKNYLELYLPARTAIAMKAKPQEKKAGTTRTRVKKTK